MIASVKGKLVHKEADCAVIDVHGLRFRLFITLSTFYDLPERGEEVSLEVHMVLREDAIQLFGFLTDSEREAFVSLLGVTGIGPKLARNVLSGIRANDLALAVMEGNSARLHAIRGVGKRMAERMLVELQGKVERFLPDRSPETLWAGQRVEGDGVERDVESALLNLGYRKTEVTRALEATRTQVKGAASLETWIKESLKLLAK
jgi:Holliday junction DNA helicase RuvA